MEAANDLLAEALENAERANTDCASWRTASFPPRSRGAGWRRPSPLSCRERAFPSAWTCRTREVEATAYFVIAEALTNIAKHSGAHEAQVRA